VDFHPANDLEPDVEAEALNGATKDTITVHAPKDNRNDNFVGRLNMLFHVKRKYDALSDGKTLWIQVGEGNPWQKDNTYVTTFGSGI
jgi:hypothetical protein